MLLINKLEILKLSLEMRQNILTTIFCIMIISMLYDILKNRKSNANIIIPQDINIFRYIALDLNRGFVVVILCFWKLWGSRADHTATNLKKDLNLC